MHQVFRSPHSRVPLAICAVVTALAIALSGANGQVASGVASVVSTSEYGGDVLGHVSIGPDGLIYVIDVSRHTVVVFDSTLKRVRELRPATGGMAGSLYAIGFVGDTLWISDAASNSISMYEEGTRLVMRVPVRVKPPAPATYYALTGIAPDGALWLEESGSLSSLGAMNNGRVVALAPRGDSLARQIARLAARHIALQLSLPNGSIFAATQPWSSTDLFDLSDNSSRMAYVKRFELDGQSVDSTIVHVFDQDGKPRWRRAFAFARVAISDSAERAAVMVPPFVVAAYPDATRAAQAIRGALYVPDSLPAIDRVVVATDGGVWLGHTIAGATRQWTVLNSDGEPEREVSVPASVRLEDVSGRWIVGVRTDHASHSQFVRLAMSAPPPTAVPSDSSPTVRLAREAISRFFPTVLSDTADPGTLFLIVDADGKLLNAAHGTLEANDKLKARYESYDQKVASMEIRTVPAGILGKRALRLVVTTFKP
jgi:hypothetical protein